MLLLAQGKTSHFSQYEAFISENISAFLSDPIRNELLCKHFVEVVLELAFYKVLS